MLMLLKMLNKVHGTDDGGDGVNVDDYVDGAGSEGVPAATLMLTMKDEDGDGDVYHTDEGDSSDHGVCARDVVVLVSYRISTLGAIVIVHTLALYPFGFNEPLIPNTGPESQTLYPNPKCCKPSQKPLSRKR